MAKMFSSLRLATMRHKKSRPGSVATSASSESTARTDETTASAGVYGWNLLALDEMGEVGCTPTSLTSKVAQV